MLGDPLDEPSGRGGLRVLLADDDRVATEILRRTIGRWRFELSSVSDGGKAWEHLSKAEGPTLAILDWMMPKMNGPEVCRRVRRERPLANIYLVLLTSLEGRNDVVAGLDAGADDYIVKPFDPDELHARIQVGVRVLELTEKLSRRVDGAAGRAVERQAASGAAADLQLLQAHPRRRPVLAAGGHLPRRAHRSPVQPRHLPAVLRKSREGDRGVQEGEHLEIQN